MKTMTAAAAAASLFVGAASAQTEYLDDFNTSFASPINYGGSDTATMVGPFDTRLATYAGSSVSTGPSSNNAQVRAGLGGIFVGESGEGVLQYNIGSDAQNVVGGLSYYNVDGSSVDLTGAVSITSELFVAPLAPGESGQYTLTVTDSFGTASVATGSLAATGDVISIDLVSAAANDGLALSSVASIDFVFDWTGVEQADSLFSAIRINSPIPTPGTGAAIALAGLAAVRRRR